MDDSNSDSHRDTVPTPSCACFPGNRKGQVLLGTPAPSIWPYPSLFLRELHLKPALKLPLRKGHRRELEATVPLFAALKMPQPNDTSPGCPSIVGLNHIGPALILHTALVKRPHGQLQRPVSPNVN